ncbi:hypothetical protein RE0346_25720 [Prescottella equi]|nr:hypothetical protein RE0346_25720 [Prescottella equi]
MGFRQDAATIIFDEVRYTFWYLLSRSTPRELCRLGTANRVPPYWITYSDLTQRYTAHQDLPPMRNA